MSKTDNQLKEDIEQELRWDPKVNAAQIGVSVDKGAVSLLGAVDTYAEKWAAEDATKRVCGVRTVAQDLTVKVLSDHVRSDSDIASAIQSAFKWDVFVPKSVTAKVHGGAVTLEGQVTWNFQRDSPNGQFAISRVLFPLLMPSPSSLRSPLRRSRRRSWRRCNDMRPQTPSRSRSMLLVAR